ncbi:MAG: hypothetical protein M1832_004095 [Thelocarpon impressellum]|nr:MAG: hypothetical protein M1832_004095 [Thelocarpon impressellum]
MSSDPAQQQSGQKSGGGLFDSLSSGVAAAGNTVGTAAGGILNTAGDTVGAATKGSADTVQKTIGSVTGGTGGTEGRDVKKDGEGK